MQSQHMDVLESKDYHLCLDCTRHGPSIINKIKNRPQAFKASVHLFVKKMKPPGNSKT